jgi:hypothetical protein
MSRLFIADSTRVVPADPAKAAGVGGGRPFPSFNQAAAVLYCAT